MINRSRHSRSSSHKRYNLIGLFPYQAVDWLDREGIAGKLKSKTMWIEMLTSHAILYSWVQSHLQVLLCKQYNQGIIGITMWDSRIFERSNQSLYSVCCVQFIFPAENHNNGGAESERLVINHQDHYYHILISHHNSHHHQETERAGSEIECYLYTV